MSSSIVDSDLYCSKCNQIYKSDPVTLSPCGWVVCSEHLYGCMNCFMCPDKHRIQTTVTSKNIQIKFLNYTNEKSRKELRKYLDDIRLLSSDKNHFVDEHYKDLKFEIETRREIVKSTIEKHFDDMLKQLESIKSQTRMEIAKHENNLDFYLNGFVAEFKNIDAEDTNKNRSLVETFEKAKKESELLKGLIETYKSEFLEKVLKIKDYKLISEEMENYDIPHMFGQLEIENLDESKEMSRMRQNYISPYSDYNNFCHDHSDFSDYD